MERKISATIGILAEGRWPQVIADKSDALAFAQQQVFCVGFSFSLALSGTGPHGSRMWQSTFLGENTSLKPTLRAAESFTHRIGSSLAWRAIGVRERMKL
jgi:hypothetical protein